MFVFSSTRGGCVSVVEKYFPVCVVCKALEKHFRAAWVAKCCGGNRHYQTEAFPAAVGPFLCLTGAPSRLYCLGRRNLNVAVSRAWERGRTSCASGERRGGMSCGEVFRWDDPSVRVGFTGGMGAGAEICRGDPPASILLCFNTPPQDVAVVGVTPH